MIDQVRDQPNAGATDTHVCAKENSKSPLSSTSTNMGETFFIGSLSFVTKAFMNHFPEN